MMTPGSCNRDHELCLLLLRGSSSLSSSEQQGQPGSGFAQGWDPPGVIQWEGSKARTWPWGSCCTCTFIPVGCCSWELLPHLPGSQGAQAPFQTSFSWLLWMCLPTECNGNLSFAASYHNINPLGGGLINSYSCQTCLAWEKRNFEELLGVADGSPEIWILQPIEKKIINRWTNSKEFKPHWLSIFPNLFQISAQLGSWYLHFVPTLFQEPPLLSRVWLDLYFATEPYLRVSNIDTNFITFYNLLL